MTAGCIYLTTQRRFHYNCLYFPDFCGKRANLHVMCPILKEEVRQGEKVRHDRWIETVCKMERDYFCCYYLSLIENGIERDEALRVYATYHGFGILRKKDHEPLARYVQRCVSQ